MKIELNSRSEILAWEEVFRLLGVEFYMSCWDAIGVPKEIISEPSHILKIARFFHTRGGEITPEKIMTSDQEVANYLEAFRMIDLGHLYKTFGRITNYYGEAVANDLYEWGERNAVHDKSIFWWEWHNIFNYKFKNDSRISNPIKKNYKQILDIIYHHTVEKEKVSDNIEMKFEKLWKTASFSSDEKAIFNIDFEKGIENKDIFIVSISLILTQECAYHIWKNINSTFEKEVRKELCQWGVNEIILSLGDDEVNWKNLESYCLSV